MSDKFEQNRYHLIATTFSMREFERVYEKRAALKQQSKEKENKDKYKHVKDLQTDLFTALHRSVHDENHVMRKDHALQKPVVKAIMESDEYKNLHKVTQLQEWEAAEATRHLTPKALDMMKDLQDELDSMQEGDGEGEGEDGEEGGAQGPGGKGAGKQKRGEMQKISLAMKNLDMETVIKDALIEVRDAVRNASEAIDGLNFDQQPMTPDRKDELSKMLESNPMAKEVLSRAPKFKQLAMATQKTKIKKGHTEISEIEQGNDLSRVLPSEFAMLAKYKDEHGVEHQPMKMLFYKKYINQELLQYSLIDNAKQTKGPMLICIDNSGSMSGERIQLAKSFGVGIMQRAMSEDRAFHGIDFSGPREIIRHDFPAGQIQAEDVIKYAGDFMGGGTCFETALQECMNVIDTSLPDTHVVFVTDGDDHINDQFLEKFLEWKEKSKAHFHGLLVDAYRAEKSEVLKFCDTCRLAIDISGKMEEYAEEIFLNF